MNKILRTLQAALFVFFPLLAISFGHASVVAVSPSTIQVGVGLTQQFSATINGVSSTAVIWGVTGPTCGGGSCGTITQTGLYSAPSIVPHPATITVSAVSKADFVSTGSATVTITTSTSGTPAISISVTPTSKQLTPSAQQQFLATVSNASNTGVLWSVSCSAISCGTISGTGLYTAPATVPVPNTVTITAESLADTTKKATATVTVVSAGSAKVTISTPAITQLNAGTQELFSATVTGPTNTTVTWSITGTGCTGTTCGTITQTGLYTAPVLVPLYPIVNIVATSQANPAASASVSIQILPVIGITLSPWTSPMTSGTSQQFAATVSGSTNTNVNWSISGTGCGSSCGTISTNGLYTSPSGVSSPIAVTVTASAQASPSKTVSAVISVVPVVTVSVSPASQSISVNAEQQFTASVTGTPNTAVQWSVSGAGCIGAGCGTVIPSGNTAFYQAPASIPSPATVSVTASLVSNSTQKGSSTVTVVQPSNNKLNGHYAFWFTGFDGAISYQAAGSFTADGNGNILNGVEDINCGPGASDVICGSAPVTAMSFTGTYVVNADSRGTLTINSSFPTATFAIAVASTSGDVRFIEADNTGVIGSGVMKRQTQSAFSNTAFNGSGYVFGLAGIDALGNRTGVLGGLSMASGAILSAKLRINDQGQFCPSGATCTDATYTLPAASSLSGTFSVDPNTGRGALILTTTDLPSGGLNFIMYVVSQNEFFLISSDPVSTNPAWSGDALVQIYPTTFQFFQAGKAIISWSDLNAGIPDTTVGALQIASSVSISSLAYDENNGGVISLNKVVCPTCALLPQQGSSETLLSGASLGTFYLYPIGFNSAFLLGSSSSVQFGKIEAESALYSANYAFGTNSMLTPGVPLRSGFVSISAAPQLSGNEDLSQNTQFLGSLALTGTWPTNLAGSGLISFTSPFPASVAYWTVSTSEVVGLQIDNNAVPNILIFEN